MAKNYYFILGLQPGASREEIKSAYRQRAKEYHPDHSGTDNQAFLDVQEAYGVLGSPVNREAYDRSRQNARDFMTQGGAPETLSFRKAAAEPLKKGRDQAADLGEASLLHSFQTYSPSFDEIFDRLWRNFGSVVRPKGEGLQDLNVEFLLTPDQARRGGYVRIFVPAQARCPTCSGRGSVGFYECWRCAGEGRITGEYPMTVAYPAGISDGYHVAIPLDRFGISNLYMTLHFRVTRTAEPEEF